MAPIRSAIALLATNIVTILSKKKTSNAVIISPAQVGPSSRPFVAHRVT